MHLQRSLAQLRAVKSSRSRVKMQKCPLGTGCAAREDEAAPEQHLAARRRSLPLARVGPPAALWIIGAALAPRARAAQSASGGV
ncbi:hypothetical protein SVAN01_06888 [Stagonosporopsis vannaccii]|nr:hypothetical protein SVAN01_06888 [Stagonosporopsis vannaccii]